MRHNGNLPGMIGRHPAMEDVYRLVRRAAQVDLPLVVVGETGTGKELVARALHALGPTPNGPFVDVNCAAVPDGLAEAELFGWERGAFTGAVRQTEGLLETARGGTLFLDEACSLTHGVQVKLLRAIEQLEFRRVGGRARVSTRFRLVAALSAPVPDLVRAGVLRDDFAYRIGGVSVELPPLRARGSDVELLAEHFLREANHNGHMPKALSPEAVKLLASYPWPGNVRELRTVMERLHAFAEEPCITAPLLAAELPAEGVTERNRLEWALQSQGWSITSTARALGISRSGLYNKMRSHGIARPAEETP